jgi:hypothetical protein
MRRIGWAVAVLTALVGAAPASAAYAPQFSFSVAPTTAGTAAAITSTITQADGETPSKTVTVTLPPGFTPNLDNKLGACNSFQEAAGTCPPESQMGQASATVSAFGSPYDFSGPVYFGGPASTPGSFRLIVRISNPALGPQTLVGISSLGGDGSIATVFDNLPNFLAKSFTLALAGGEKALLKTPSTCGTFPVNASFVSQTGEQASGSAPLAISGCSTTSAPSAPAAPSAPNAPATPLRVGAPKLTRAGVVTFTLSAPAKVTVTVRRAGKRVARRSVSGRTGANRARLGRRLKAGRYAVTLAAVNAAGKKVTRRATVRLR